MPGICVFGIQSIDEDLPKTHLLAQRARRRDICYNMALEPIVHFGMESLMIEAGGHRLRMVLS
jgi:hypothetical protein